MKNVVCKMGTKIREGIRKRKIREKLRGSLIANFLDLSWQCCPPSEIWSDVLDQGFFEK